MNEQWAAYRESEAFAARVATLYGAGEDVLALQKARYGKLVERFEARFGKQNGGLYFFSAPGRTEIGGNHTDHNNGRVLAAAVDLDTIACVSKTDDNKVVVDSEGFAPITITLDSFEIREADFGTTLSLIRGTAAVMKDMGYKVGGFRATVSSSVLRGSGLSSSAAFEVLIGAIIDGLYNGFVVDAKTRAVIAQKVENIYFGKPCGLMDQMASSVGGLVAIDFGKDDPVVTAMKFDFEAAGYVPAVVSVGGEHGNLTADYAAIPAEMKSVAEALGGKVLADIDPKVMEEAIPQLKNKVKDRAILRALHFYDENERVDKLVAALEDGDITTFFEMLIASGESSWKLLQNLYVAGSDNEEMPLALELSRRMLEGCGAWRIHGGGFAGTILVFLPKDMVAEYTERMNAVFGEGAVTPLMIRADGAVQILY